MENHLYLEVVYPWFRLGGASLNKKQKLHFARNLETQNFFLYTARVNFNGEIEEKELQRWLDEGWVKRIESKDIYGY